MRLLICDDHRLLVDALRLALTLRGYTVVATALDPYEAVTAAREHQPDACLLDVSFPNANGLSVISWIHEVSADTKVVMLSASSDWDLVADAIAHGAVGFVGKEKPVEAIFEALETVQRGHLAVDPPLLRSLRTRRRLPEHAHGHRLGITAGEEPECQPERKSRAGVSRRRLR